MTVDIRCDVSALQGYSVVVRESHRASIVQAVVSSSCFFSCYLMVLSVLKFRALYFLLVGEVPTFLHNSQENGTFPAKANRSLGAPGSWKQI